MRCKTHSKNTFPPPSLLFRVLLPTPAAQGDREWGLWSVHDLWLLPLLRERSPPPAALWAPLPWETELHELLQCESIPQAAVLPKLLQCGSLFQGCSPPGTGLSSLGAGPLSPWSSHGVTASSRHPPAPAQAPPWAAGGSLHSPWISRGCRGRAVSPWAAGESRHLEHLLPFLLH